MALARLARRLGFARVGRGHRLFCGSTDKDSGGSRPRSGPTAARKGVVFVGFDASEPLVDAMRQGKIQGLVVQNPLRMGELASRRWSSTSKSSRSSPRSRPARRWSRPKT